ncbi:MAG: hypothetical protein IPO30_00440 [Hyphomonadaceae bacterium]|nr:hypothetical protein [Hyphomonadaceae bacterium]
MNEARFMELLSGYGAELSRWPEDDRGDAEAFLDGAPHRIKDIWESERAFDHLLALEKDSPPSLSLETRVLAVSPDRRGLHRPAGVFAGWRAPQWLAGSALAASLAFGFAVGYANEPKHGSDSAYAAMFTGSGAGAGSMLLSAMNEPESSN